MPLLSLVPRPLVWVRPNLLAQDLETDPGSPTGSSGMGYKTEGSTPLLWTLCALVLLPPPSR